MEIANTMFADPSKMYNAGGVPAPAHWCAWLGLLLYPQLASPTSKVCAQGMTDACVLPLTFSLHRYKTQPAAFL